MTGPALALLAACSAFEAPQRLPCTGPTCVDVVARARLYTAPHDGSVKLGDELAVYGDLVLVGAPSYPTSDILAGTTFVTGLSLPGFGPVGTWYSKTASSTGRARRSRSRTWTATASWTWPSGSRAVGRPASRVWCTS